MGWLSQHSPEEITAYATAIIAIGTVLYTAANVLLVSMVIRQLREMRHAREVMSRELAETARSRKLIALMPLYEDFNSTRAVEDRQHVYRAYLESPDHLRSAKRDDRQACENVIYTFSRLGVLLHRNLIDEGDAVEFLPNLPARFWMLLREYFAESEARLGKRTPGFKAASLRGIEYWLLENRGEEARIRVFHPDGKPLTAEFSRAEIETEALRLREELREHSWLNEHA